jgi:hypothetical protein
VFAVLVAAFLAACGWRAPRDQWQWATEYSLVTALLLLTSALSWTYFFVMLLLPAMQALRLVGQPTAIRPVSARALRGALWGLVLAALLLGNHYARALGSVFWATMLTFAALAMARYDLRREAPAG